MSFSRSSPSEDYIRLNELNRLMHEEGERFVGLSPSATFAGFSLDPHLHRIKKWIDATASRTVLDYGCGKGKQYDRSINDVFGEEYTSVKAYWGLEEIVCYDPCYSPFAGLPVGKFDGVLSTDVLEHCPIEDLSWIVREIFGYAEKFVFANVACYPARKRLPNGENAHCTLMPADWWHDLFACTATNHPGVLWELSIHTAPKERHMSVTNSARRL